MSVKPRRPCHDLDRDQQWAEQTAALLLARSTRSLAPTAARLGLSRSAAHRRLRRLDLLYRRLQTANDRAGPASAAG